MTLHTDGSDLDAAQIAAIEAGMKFFDIPDTDVLATCRFPATVSKLTGSTSYHTDRGAGTVGAKTIPLPSGRHVVVVNWPAIEHYDSHDLQRLLAHEGGHVLLGERKEVGTGRHHLAQTQPDYNLLFIAGDAADEFRIERDVSAHYGPAESVDVTHLTDVLSVLNTAVLDAVRGRASATVESMAAAVVGALNDLTKPLAYLAAAGPLGEDGPVIDGLDGIGRENWEDYVEPLWQRRLALYESIPSARNPIENKYWERTLLELRDLERAQLQALGFIYNGFPDDTYEFRRVGSDKLFNARLRRFQHDMQEQGMS